MGFVYICPTDQKSPAYRAQMSKRAAMMAGPFYDAATQTLRIPSYLYSEMPVCSGAAAAEWKRRGLKWDAPRQEWYIRIAPRIADEQVAKARQVFDAMFYIERDANGNEIFPSKRIWDLAQGEYVPAQIQNQETTK